MGHVDRVPYPAKRNDFDSAKFEGNVMRQKVSARISALVAYRGIFLYPVESID